MGKGTTFYFTALYGIPDNQGAKDMVTSVDLDGVRTLLVVHPASRDILHELFLSLKALVSHADDEHSALVQLTEAVHTPNAYGLLVLDLATDDVGISASRIKLLTTAKDQGIMVIVMVTDVRSPVIALCYRLGLGGYVTKPVTKAKLEEVLERAYNRLPRGAPQDSPTPVTESEDCPCILMAEDSPDNQRLIELYLKPTRYRLEIVANGRAAFDNIRQGDMTWSSWTCKCR